jgi:uncharacterized protein YjfI (DUF2170 family)
LLVKKRNTKIFPLSTFTGPEVLKDKQINFLYNIFSLYVLLASVLIRLLNCVDRALLVTKNWVLNQARKGMTRRKYAK